MPAIRVGTVTLQLALRVAVAGQEHKQLKPSCLPQPSNTPCPQLPCTFQLVPVPWPQYTLHTCHVPSPTTLDAPLPITFPRPCSLGLRNRSSFSLSDRHVELQGSLFPLPLSPHTLYLSSNLRPFSSDWRSLKRSCLLDASQMIEFLRLPAFAAHSRNRRDTWCSVEAHDAAFLPILATLIVHAGLTAEIAPCHAMPAPRQLHGRAWLGISAYAAPTHP